MLVRPLAMMSSPPVERSTSSELGAGLWRLWRRCGRVRSGYSSRPECGRSTGTLGSRGADFGGACCCCCCRRCGVGGARGELFCGFQRREAGGRGGPAGWYRPRRLRLKMRLVSDQRCGAVGGASGVVAAVGGWGVLEVIVTGWVCAVKLKLRLAGAVLAA